MPGPNAPRDYRENPKMDLAYQKLRAEMPKEVEGVSSLGPMNWVERQLFPRAQGVTWPWGRVAYSPENIARDPEAAADPTDMLAHELTHVGQAQERGVLGSLWRSIVAPKDYQARDYEAEAFATEGKRKAARRDIELPPSVRALRQYNR